MKKVTLLFTLLCVSALNSMHPTSIYELQRTEPEQNIEDLIKNAKSLTLTDLRPHNTNETENPDAKHIRLGAALLGIIRSGHFLSVIDMIIFSNADVNYYDEMNKVTPLIYALRYQDPNMVKLLLLMDADPNFTGPYTESYAIKVLKEEDVSEKDKKMQLILDAMNK